ncbi:MAG: glycosyltransferase [Saprospiraceae bacterium]
MDEPWEDINKAGKWLQHLANKIKPDIIHFNHYAHAQLQWEAPVVVVAHSCVYTWWQAVHGTPPPPQWKAYHDLVNNNIKAANWVVSVSETFLKQFQQYYSNDYKSSIIHNGITFLAEKHLPKQEFIFAMGRIWDEAKNLAILDQVAPHIPWKIEVAGDTFHPVLQCNQTLNCVEHLGLLDRAAVLQKLAQASIFIAPTKYEPFGLAPLEAAAQGCALVLADLPSQREIWGDAAFYFNPYDTTSLINIINQLIENEPLRKEYAQKAFAKSKYYTSATMADKYVKIYKYLLAQKKHSPGAKEMLNV